MDVLTIMATAATSMLCSEMVGWFFVYRTERYQNAVARVKKLSKLYKEAKKAPAQSKKNPATKYKAELKQLSSETTGSSMKSTVFLVVIHWLTFTLLSRSYDGVVVAKLPFESFGLLR